MRGRRCAGTRRGLKGKAGNARLRTLSRGGHRSIALAFRGTRAARGAGIDVEGRADVVAHLHHDLARGRYDGQDHADGEHGRADREGRPQHRLTPVPGPLRCPPARCLPRVAPSGRLAAFRVRVACAADRGQTPDQGSEEARDGQPNAPRTPGPAGVGRTRPYLVADALQAVRARLHLIRGSVELAAQEVGEVLPLPVVEAVAGSHHDSRSSSARSAAMPRAV